MKLNETKAFPHGIKIRSLRHSLCEIKLEGNENGMKTFHLCSRVIACLHVVQFLIPNDVQLSAKSIEGSANKYAQYNSFKAQKFTIDECEQINKEDVMH